MRVDHRTRILAFTFAISALVAQAQMRPDMPAQPATMMSSASQSLTGAWKLVRCDNVYPDGHRIELYGPNPDGLWLIDANGNYSMLIVRAQRDRFVANDKSKGTPEEYRAASLNYNAHYGHLSVEGMKLHVHIDHASFPNWDGRDSSSSFTLHGDELAYTVAAPSSGASEGAKGEVVWRRQSAPPK